MPGHTPQTPPVVRYRGAAGYAYLLAQVHTDQGWRLRVAWVERHGSEPYQWRLEVAEVPPDTVQQVQHEHYGGVPREYRSQTPPAPDETKE